MPGIIYGFGFEELTVLRRCSAATARAKAMRSKMKTTTMMRVEAMRSGGDLGSEMMALEQRA